MKDLDRIQPKCKHCSRPIARIYDNYWRHIDGESRSEHCQGHLIEPEEEDRKMSNMKWNKVASCIQKYTRDDGYTIHQITPIHWRLYNKTGAAVAETALYINPLTATKWADTEIKVIEGDKEMSGNETIILKKADLLKAHSEGCSATKKALENLYPDVFQPQTFPMGTKFLCDGARYILAVLNGRAYLVKYLQAHGRDRAGNFWSINPIHYSNFEEISVPKEFLAKATILKEEDA